MKFKKILWVFEKLVIKFRKIYKNNKIFLQNLKPYIIVIYFVQMQNILIKI